MSIKQTLHYFSPFEWVLWLGSVAAITLSALLGQDFHWLSLCSSIFGVTSLIFIAKGNVVGQFLVIVFSVLYALVSLEQRYYGEMITYVFMSLPAAVCACVSWLKNPSKNAKNEVQVATMSLPKWIFLSSSSVLVTLLFFFVLRYFQTNNLPVSTLSVTTSYLASVLLIFRSRYYALAYAANDIVLIVLWVYACFSSLSYLSMVICFCAFLFNDIYAFYNWKRIQKRQNEQEN
ncbi:MAG: nicotinamide mononucleotide transporter [Clostridia bacterium]|nr:nicotinamide mononucleotide transporter [Clostridia bacterium]